MPSDRKYQISIRQLCIRELRLAEVYASEIRLSKIDSAQIQAAQTGTREVRINRGIFDSPCVPSCDSLFENFDVFRLRQDSLLNHPLLARSCILALSKR